MSLLLDATGDYIEHPSASPSESGGVLIWIYISDDTLRMTCYHHLGGSDLQIGIRGDLAGDPFEAFRGGTAYWEAQTAAANYAAYGTNKWLCLAWLYGGSAPDLWLGDESSAMAAPTSYSGFRNTGSGAFTTSGVIRVGANFTSSRWWRNRIGAYAWWNGTRPSTAEAEAWRKDPWGYRAERGSVFPQPTFWGRPGINGTTDVPDETGGSNTGTITGLSSPDRQPAVAFPSAVFPPRGAVYQPFLVR